jgi:hypothetical protein
MSNLSEDHRTKIDLRNGIRSYVYTAFPTGYTFWKDEHKDALATAIRDGICKMNDDLATFKELLEAYKRIKRFYEQ